MVGREIQGQGAAERDGERLGWGAGQRVINEKVR